MALVRIQVVEEECEDWDTDFLVDDTISEKDLGIQELCSEDKDEKMSAQTLENVYIIYFVNQIFGISLQISRSRKTLVTVVRYIWQIKYAKIWCS